jgi:hypothetical protein
MTPLRDRIYGALLAAAIAAVLAATIFYSF